MRTCTLRMKAKPAPSRNTPANRYHWISRNAFELKLNSLRMMALPALISTDASTSQRISRPIWALSVSTPAESLSNAVTGTSSRTEATATLSTAAMYPVQRPATRRERHTQGKPGAQIAGYLRTPGSFSVPAPA